MMLVVGLIVAILIVTPATGLAQQAGSIAGVVRDTSGAVMPGVTVEASSPALIEQVRTGVTDGEGFYRIIDLRPGVYTVTFILPGFRTLRREGIEMTTGFVATVNAELTVGALEESITVTGAAPVVDTQSIRQQSQFSSETLTAIPGTGRISALYTVLPSAVLDNPTMYSVGNINERAAANIASHGAPRGSPVIDGMNQISAGLNQGVVVYNNLTFQEVVVETTGIGADRADGGTQMNIVQKDGGNTFSGSFLYAASGSALESNNYSDALGDRGIKEEASESLKKFSDVGGSLGGPLVRDKLWFFGAARHGVTQQYAQGVFYNRAQSTFIGPGVVAYEPDPSRPSFTDEFSSDYTLRLTWQAAEKHKIAVQSSFQPNCNCLFALLTTTGTIPAPEGTGRHYYNPNAMPSLTWSYPASNRVLFEGGVSANLHHQTTKRIAGVTEQHIQITDQALNMRYGARASSLAVGGSYSHNPRRIYQGRFSMSYIPGSHNVKVGLDIRRFNEGNLDKNRDLNQHNQGRSYTFLRAGVPRSVTLWAVPHGFEESLRDVGLYAQDQWRIRNLTLNYGLRYNDVKAWTPEQLLVAGYFVPERRVAAVDNVPHWRNLDPRLGAAYDLFGDGRTALKGSLGRYATRLVSAAENPARNMAASTTLNWTDSNNNLAPDCNLLNPKGEDNRAVGGDLCGGYNNLNFGQVVPGTRNAEDALEGFNLQDYNWQGSVSIQHELRPNVGLNVGYFRTWYGNFLVSDNQAIATDGQPLGPSHYDSFCITVPTDDRLPTSGERLCGLYDIRPAEFGKTDNVVTQASNFGTQTQVYNGVDATLNARLAQGMQFQGGISVGRTATNNCFLNNDASLDPASTSPRIDSFCDTTPPWSSGTQFRGLFVYPLPWQLQASVTYQNIPGIPITADQVLSNAQVAPELGRNLAACPATGACTANITVQLVPNGVAYEERLQQLDVRLTGLFRLQRLRLRGNFDVYNIFNANNVLRLQTRYAGVSSSWLNAINVMGGRLVKFGVQVDF